MVSLISGQFFPTGAGGHGWVIAERYTGEPTGMATIGDDLWSGNYVRGSWKWRNVTPDHRKTWMFGSGGTRVGPSDSSRMALTVLDGGTAIAATMDKSLQVALYTTGNAGDTWSQMTSAPLQPTTCERQVARSGIATRSGSIWFTAPDVGWLALNAPAAAGNRGACLFGSTDGGRNWTLDSVQAGGARLSWLAAVPHAPPGIRGNVARKPAPASSSGSVPAIDCSLPRWVVGNRERVRHNPSHLPAPGGAADATIAEMRLLPDALERLRARPRATTLRAAPPGRTGGPPVGTHRGWSPGSGPGGTRATATASGTLGN